MPENTRYTTTDQLVPLPAGAVKVFDWEHPDVTGLPETMRYFDGTLRSSSWTSAPTTSRSRWREAPREISAVLGQHPVDSSGGAYISEIKRSVIQCV
jgi:hypothetical protein